VKLLLIGNHGEVILKLNPSGKSIFGNWRSRLVVVAVFSAVLALLTSFALMPLLSGVPVEQEIILEPCSASTYQQIGTSTDYQSKYSLSTMVFPPKSYIQLMSDTRPSVTISLEGTLGANGWYTSNVEASLYLTGGDPASLTIEYAFYNQGWKTFVEPLTIFEEGQTTIYYRVRNATGFVWETTVSTVDIDKTPPNGSVLIDAGAEDAFSTLVDLTLSVIDAPSGPTTPPPPGYIWGVPSGPSDMRFSNNGILWSNWEPIANSKSWTMETGAGNKTVYVQARDNAGLVSEKISDTINLITTSDSLAPVTSITLSGSQNSLGVYTSDVIIILSPTDDLSGINLTEYSFDAKNWTTYLAPFAISAEGQTTIYYRTHDLAGNVESTNSQTLNIERTEKSDSTILSLEFYGTVAAVVISIIVTIVLMRRKKRQFKKTPSQKKAATQESSKSPLNL
jgi:hypothetical protein